MKVIKCSTQEDFFNSVLIRSQVFLIEQAIDPTDEFDYNDLKADHYLLYKKEKAVATARIICLDGIYYLGRVATLKDFRRQGYSTTLIKEIIENYPKPIYLHAQIQALDFYHTLGFIEEGSSFFETGIEHVKMVLK